MNSKIKLFLKKASELGLDNDNLSKTDIKKIKLFNTFCFCWYIIAFILITNYLIKKPINYINISAHLIEISIVFIGQFLHAKKKFNIGRAIFVSILLINGTFFGLIFRPGKFIEFYLILVPGVSLVFFNNKKTNIAVLIISFLCFAIPNEFIKIYPKVKLYGPAMSCLFFAYFILINYFKNLNLKNEKLLAIERDKALSDKIILEKQEIQLRELNEFKSHFFVNLSHEIRTPITLIKGYTSNINLKDNTDINNKKLDVVGNQINQIETILNNILNLSKLDANKLTLERNDIEIIPFLNKHYADFKELFNKKNITFNIAINISNLYVNMDPNLIEKSIYNLLSNALKFTPKKGTVSITVNLNDNLEINFCDNGIGIPEEDINKIFERFYQSKNDITKSQGSGIGLSFTKSIINTHGFSITANSIPNTETCFSILIPKQYTSKAKDYSQLENQDKNTTLNIEPDIKISLKKKEVKTVLIVDDHEQMRNYLASTLKEYNILEAEDGKEALKVIKNKKIDLLLTDYMMPIMDGKALVKEVKKMNLKIPIIVLTARVDDAAKLNMLRIGVDGYLNKPFVEEELLLTIKKSLELYSNIVDTQKHLTVTEKKELDDKAHEFNQKILKYINNNISNTEFTIHDIADYFNMSQSTLNRKTKTILGQTTQQVLMHIRVEKARDIWLKNPYLSKKEIGYKVGIINTSYLFKKIDETYGKKHV